MLTGSRYLLGACMTLAMIGWISAERAPQSHPVWLLSGMFGIAAILVMLMGFYRGEKW